MKPIVHARLSAKRYGGKPEDYMPIHDFMDSTKSALPDIRHRAILHSAFGCFLVERVFGTTITNSDNRSVCVRDIAEDHVIEDIGFIPTIERWLSNMPVEPWMAGGVKKFKKESQPQEVETEKQIFID
jgi:hypothetical protein